jgi:alanine dehydrogenase
MRVGVAREIKLDEYRVALTPAGTVELVQRGHEVLVERGAGDGSGLPDEAYAAVGASMVAVDEVWERSELLLKVKEPIEQEYARLHDDLILFTFLHMATDAPLTSSLVDSGVTAIAYETAETGDGRPLLGGAPGKVVVIGGGIVGYNAAVMALGLGAQVTILERSIERMRHLEEVLQGASRCRPLRCSSRRLWNTPTW